MDKSWLATIVLSLAMMAPTARAADLKVLAGGSMTASLKELGPRFEKATGHKLDITFAATPELIRMASSAPFDLGVVPVDVLKNDGARAKFVAGPNLVIARVGYGVAVRSGAAKPDIGTPDKLKQTLLRAQSVALLPASAAGAFVLKTFDKLGIADAMKEKIKAQTSPAQIPAAVASGDAELGVFLTNVLIAPGVEPAVPFPAELQEELVFVGAVAAESKDAAAAKTLLDYLKTPEAMAVFRGKGVTPG